jgi:hypothetical protein
MIVYSFVVLLLVSIVPSNSLECYECGCDGDDLSACECGFVTTSTEIDYCIILEDRYTPDSTYFQLSRIPRNATLLYIKDPYYVLTQESIRYNLTTSEWYVWVGAVIFGCDWDRCNSPSLIPSSPNSFNLTINTTWLDTNIYGNGSVDGCYVCPTQVCGDTSNPGNFSECEITSCGNITTVI